MQPHMLICRPIPLQQIREVAFFGLPSLLPPPPFVFVLFCLFLSCWLLFVHRFIPSGISERNMFVKYGLLARRDS